MNNEHDQLEQMLKDRLTPTAVSRTAEARMRQIWSKPVEIREDVRERRMRLQLHVWQWAFATAAAVAVVIAVARLQVPTPVAPTAPAIAATNTAAAGQPMVATTGTAPLTQMQTVSALPSVPTDVPVETRQRILGAEDQGLSYCDANQARRQVRVRYLDTQRWQTPSGEWVERSVPREATLQIPVGRVHDNGSGAVQEGPVHIIGPNPGQ